MADYNGNHNLTYPEGGDYYDVEVFNQNFSNLGDSIDDIDAVDAVEYDSSTLSLSYTMLSEPDTSKLAEIGTDKITEGSGMLASSGAVYEAVKTACENIDLSGYALITEAGYSLSLSIDESSYIMTLALVNKSGAVLDTKTIDFPIESMVAGAKYDSGVITLTLQNGEICDVDVSALVSGLVNSSLTVAGIALEDNITAAELLEALGLNDVIDGIEYQADSLSLSYTRVSDPDTSKLAEIGTDKITEGSGMLASSGAVYEALQGLAAASIVIAASDTDETLAARANYICEGNSDQTVINTAIASLSSGGKIVLLPGTYVTDGSISVSNSNVWLCGCGNSTVLQFSDGTVGVYIYGNYNKISDLAIDSSVNFAVSFYANSTGNNASFCTAENLTVTYSKGYAVIFEGSYILSGGCTRINNITTVCTDTDSSVCAFSLSSGRTAIFTGCIGVNSSGTGELSEHLRGEYIFSGCVGYDV